MNFQSESWREIACHLEKLRTTESERLEGQTKDLLETQYIRGKIAAYKELLALPKNQAARAQVDEPQ